MRMRIIIGIIVVLIIAIVWVISLGDSSEEVVVAEEGQKEEQEQKLSGDALESAINRLSEVAATLTKSEVRKNIVGVWQSLDNPDYAVEFSSDGVMTEELADKQMAGSWKLVSYEDGPKGAVGTVSFSQDGVFLRQSLDQGKTHFYYKVVQADEDRLVTIYLHQAGILTFDRVK